jgi:arylsulfatase A-like enzyme
MNKKPNIIYILADDMGYGDISCLNEKSKIRTENIDKLAGAGIRFTDAHSSSAVCTPSRYSILTGRYNWRSRLKSSVLFGSEEHLVEDGRTTIASFLKPHGYNSAMIGKWHLGWDWATTDGGLIKGDLSNIDFTKPVTNGPDACGFDYYYGHVASLDIPPYVYVENGNITAAPDRITENDTKFGWWRKGPTGADFEHQDVLPNFTKRSINYIEQQAKEDNPFFLYFPLPAPHTPILPSKEFIGKSGTNLYGDFCLMVDDVVGLIVDAVERAGITDNTIIVFTSDNGCSPQADVQELEKMGHNPSYIYRGYKADIYEGGHRIPLIIRWPETIAVGSVSKETVCLSDMLATCADIVGEPLADNEGEDSVSNLPLWQGEALDKSLREATVHHSIDGSFSIRKGKWKLEMCAGSGGWSYPKPGEECDGLPDIQLYNLDSDISETTNVYNQFPEIVEELKTLLTKYVVEGRSTPGKKQANCDGISWAQLWWILSEK